VSRRDFQGDYFLFIESSKGGPARLLTNTACVLSSDISSSPFTIYPAPPAVSSSSTFNQGNVSNHTHGNTTGDSSIVDTNDKAKSGRQRRRTKKKWDKNSLPTTLEDPSVLPLPVQEKSMGTSNISLNISSTSEPKGFSVDSGVQEVPRLIQEAETAIPSPLAVPQVGTHFQHASPTQPISRKGWIP
jgi:hypothetical protein